MIILWQCSTSADRQTRRGRTSRRGGIPRGSGTGPNLKGVFGSDPASKEGFTYSGAMQALKGKTWKDGTLDKYLKSPADYAPGNAMAFAGIANAKDRGDVIAYLKANA